MYMMISVPMERGEMTMRDNLFHGKRNDNGEWIEGCSLDANNIGVFHDDTELLNGGNCE